MHTPVLLSECLEGLRIKPDGVYVDGTLGRGGHSREIAELLDTGRLIAIDRDAEAIKEASGLLSAYEGKITYIHDDFGNLSEILDGLGIGLADGMLFDFGASSPQLDDSKRGFSYMRDAPLDMRMDTRGEVSAFDIVNNWPEDMLRDIFFKYGEERYARPIARGIVRRRESEAIGTTFQLNEVIASAIPAAARREPQHPSKRCFQAIRIAVNNELESISGMLGCAPDRLRTGGRICVISFHSLEDRLVKNEFAARAKGCTCPKDFPVCVCGKRPQLRLIAKKPVTPSLPEKDRNPRSRSARLRIAERL
jgi:16S rRNA (cytosine1402-N4)-methyltransferase